LGIALPASGLCSKIGLVEQMYVFGQLHMTEFKELLVVNFFVVTYGFTVYHSPMSKYNE